MKIETDRRVISESRKYSRPGGYGSVRTAVQVQQEAPLYEQPECFNAPPTACGSVLTELMIGTDFPYQPFFPKDATIVQIDIRGEQLGRRTKLDYGFVGDTKTTLRALLPKLNQNDNDKHLKALLAHYKNARKGLDELATNGSSKKPIHPQYVVRVLDEVAAKDAIFCCDVGTPTIWAARYLTMNGKQQ